MSNVATPGDLSDLPTGTGGSAAAEFGPLVRAFARAFGHRRGAGGALAVYLHGEPLVHIWTGSTTTGAWDANSGAIIFSASKGITATVIHRLADRGLLDYAAPMAEYWPEFGANGKQDITIRQVMTHSAGLSSLMPLAIHPTDVLDHELMEERLAAAKPDHLLGIPTYHALTFGWLLAGLARAITGRSMGELFRSEVADPLGVEGIHLGRPPAAAPTTFAGLTSAGMNLASSGVATRVLERSHALPGPLGAASRCLGRPGMAAILTGTNPPMLDTEMGAGNAVCTADALATMYSAIANDGVFGGRRYLSTDTIRTMSRIQSYRLDHALFYTPMLWHLGYHSLPMPGAANGFGHIGLGGSFGWADPRVGLSVGFVHNRLSVVPLAMDMSTAAWVLPLTLNCLRNTRRATLDETAEVAA